MIFHFTAHVHCALKGFVCVFVDAGYLTTTIMTATGFVKRSHAGYSYYTFEGDANTAKQTHYKDHGTTLRCSLRRKNTTLGNPLPEAKPIVFLHGVGLGILPYVDFIYSLVCSGKVLFFPQKVI